MLDAAELAEHRRRVDARDQHVARLKAALGARGYQLHVGVGGAAFVVARWSLHRELPDIEAAEQFAAQVGVAP